MCLFDMNCFSKKLFKIKIFHAAQKDSHTSIETYLIADNEEKVFKWIDKKLNYGNWENAKEEEEKEYDEETDDYIPFKDYVMKHKGELDIEDYSDAYYGITRYGWEEIAEISDVEIDILLKLKIAIEV